MTSKIKLSSLFLSFFVPHMVFAASIINDFDAGYPISDVVGDIHHVGILNNSTNVGYENDRGGVWVYETDRTHGDDPPSVSFNTIVFNDLSHHALNPTQTERAIKRYKNTSTYSYVSGDITNSYKRAYNTNRCELFKRSVLHIRPGVVVVYDVTRSSSLGNNKKWYTQYVANPEISGNTISVVSGSSNGFITTLYPEGGSYTETNPATGFYRVYYTPGTEQEYDRFLNVIETTSTTGAKTETSMVAGIGCIGAIIGNTVAIFTNDQGGADFSYGSYTVDATTHYISDLPANTEINIKRDGIDIITQTTDGNGILEFSSTSGSAVYSVSTPESTSHDQPTINAGSDQTVYTATAQIVGTAAAAVGVTITGVTCSGQTVTPDDGTWDEQNEAWTCNVTGLVLGSNVLEFIATQSDDQTGSDSVTVTRSDAPVATGITSTAVSHGVIFK